MGPSFIHFAEAVLVFLSMIVLFAELLARQAS